MRNTGTFIWKIRCEDQQYDRKYCREEHTSCESMKVVMEMSSAEK